MLHCNKIWKGVGMNASYMIASLVCIIVGFSLIPVTLNGSKELNYNPFMSKYEKFWRNFAGFASMILITLGFSFFMIAGACK